MKLVTQTDTPDTFRNWLSVVDILKKISLQQKKIQRLSPLESIKAIYMDYLLLWEFHLSILYQ
jgi:hypothetical protein